MTDIEIRLKCLDIFASIGSKTGLEKGYVFELAERGYKFVKGIPENTVSPTPSIMKPEIK